MNITIDKESKFLYHYTSKEKLIEFILPSLNLKLNFLKNTNDPKEKKMSTRFAIKNIEFAGEYLELGGRLRELIDTKYKVCCFSGDYLKDSEKYFGYQLVRMWATYGDNHKGVCLVIDKEKFSKENEVDNINTVLQEINYDASASNQIYKESKDLNTNYDQATEDLINYNINTIFFSKHHDWITENEIRFVTNSDRKFCSIENSLQKIILGMDFNLKYRPSITEQFRERKIEVQRIDYDHLSGELKLK